MSGSSGADVDYGIGVVAMVWTKAKRTRTKTLRTLGNMNSLRLHTRSARERILSGSRVPLTGLEHVSPNYLLSSNLSLFSCRGRVSEVVGWLFGQTTLLAKKLAYRLVLTTISNFGSR